MKLRNDLTVKFNKDRLEEALRYGLTVALLQFERTGVQDIVFHEAGTIENQDGRQFRLRINGTDFVLSDYVYAIIRIRSEGSSEPLEVVVEVKDAKTDDTWNKEYLVIGVYELEDHEVSLVFEPENMSFSVGYDID